MRYGYDEGKNTATHLLQHYFSLVAQRAGVQWDSDNEAEVELIVDGLLGAARAQALSDLHLDAGAHEAVAHTVHAVLDARAQARRELEALDLEDYAQQPVDATQEDGADSMPAVSLCDTDVKCSACGETIVVHFVHSDTGAPMANACPACGAAWLSFETVARTQEAQPVPVSAIAYLMADIAPVDAQDVAKQQEARATVIAWLESLEAQEE